MKDKFHKIFSIEKAVIGMIHVGALPGTPMFKGDINKIISDAVREAEIYADCGVHSVMLENMNDIPYLNRSVGPEITAAMTAIGWEVKRSVKLPVGIQILAGANKEALAAAKAANLDYVRAEGFVFAHVADEGIISSDAGELLRYRKTIDAENVLIFTDIKKKHSAHSITNDVDIAETAMAAEYFLSDGVIITGKSTSEKTDTNDLKNVRDNVNIPVLIGSGLTTENLPDYYGLADGFIVGSYFKKDGKWTNSVDAERVSSFISRFKELI